MSVGALCFCDAKNTSSVVHGNAITFHLAGPIEGRRQNQAASSCASQQSTVQSRATKALRSESAQLSRCAICEE
eukprot:8889737-Pyramimonas_sp.AAC.1